MIDFSRTGNAK